MSDAREQYLNDPTFQRMTDVVLSLLVEAQMTPSEVRAAAVLACIKYEETSSDPRYTRPPPEEEDTMSEEAVLVRLEPAHIAALKLAVLNRARYEREADTQRYAINVMARMDEATADTPATPVAETEAKEPRSWSEIRRDMERFLRRCRLGKPTFDGEEIFLDATAAQVEQLENEITRLRTLTESSGTSEKVYDALAKAYKVLGTVRDVDLRGRGVRLDPWLKDAEDAVRIQLQVMQGLRAPSESSENAETVVAAALLADWGQVVANGGPPCFHVERRSGLPRFCFRAERWAGHGPQHEFVTLAALIRESVKGTALEPSPESVQAGRTIDPPAGSPSSETEVIGPRLSTLLDQAHEIGAGAVDGRNILSAQGGEDLIDLVRFTREASSSPETKYAGASKLTASLRGYSEPAIHAVPLDSNEHNATAVCGQDELVVIEPGVHFFDIDSSESCKNCVRKIHALRSPTTEEDRDG